ncbi:hypothetical protein BHM03_00009673 [Ensete ventricosum]|nr:hypothetical protein BHM03_00009673 [Ensete ventricosum]
MATSPRSFSPYRETFHLLAREKNRPWARAATACGRPAGTTTRRRGRHERYACTIPYRAELGTLVWYDITNLDMEWTAKRSAYRFTSRLVRTAQYRGTIQNFNP